MPILHLSQLIGVAAGLRGVGAEVQAARRLGRAGRREALGLNRASGRRSPPSPGSRPAGSRGGSTRPRWVRLDELEVPLPGLPPELAGLRIAHLSDFHLGVPSPATRAVERAVDWVAERQPDLVARHRRPARARRGRRAAARADRRGCRRSTRCSATTTSPTRATRSRSRSARSTSARATLLSDEAVTLELRGRRVQLVGVDPRSYMRMARRGRGSSPTRTADLRILLCHFPRVVDRAPAGRVRPRPRRPHARRPDLPAVPGREGAARAPAGARTTTGSTGPGGATLHVSPGSGRRSCRSASSRGRRRPSSSLQAAASDAAARSPA